MENLTQRVPALLTTKFIARHIEYYDSTDSTNEAAKRASPAPGGALFIAEEQTAGRGRRGRAWVSPRGCGIWMSLLLKPDVKPGYIARITLVAGLAVCRAIGGGARIKWPNDIVIGTRKVCGILTENTSRGVICGIGINVNTAQFPPELRAVATSLYLQTGERHDRAELIAAVMNEFEPMYERFLTDGFAPLRDEYRRLCVTLGRDVSISGAAALTGIAADIDADGALVVDTGTGRVTVASGEVSVRGIYGYV